MTGPAPSWFEVRALTLLRGHRRVLDEVAFELDPGEAILVQGPNGSGKSSLLRALLGLSVATGTLRLGGEGFPPASGKLRRHVLYQGHASGLKADLNASENLALAAGLDGFDAGDESLRSALSETGLARDRANPTRRLSQGQRQRIVLARLALANRQAANARPLWLLDEPSASLDAAGTALLDALLEAHLGRGGSAVVATHLPILEGSRLAKGLRRIDLG
jgi:heme exporter protein A